MEELQRPKFALKAFISKFLRCFWRRNQVWALDHYHTSYLTIYKNNFRYPDIFENILKTDHRLLNLRYSLSKLRPKRVQYIRGWFIIRNLKTAWISVMQFNCLEVISCAGREEWKLHFKVQCYYIIINGQKTNHVNSKSSFLNDSRSLRTKNMPFKLLIVSY